MFREEITGLFLLSGGYCPDLPEIYPFPGNLQDDSPENTDLAYRVHPCKTFALKWGGAYTWAGWKGLEQLDIAPFRSAVLAKKDDQIEHEDKHLSPSRGIQVVRNKAGLEGSVNDSPDYARQFFPFVRKPGRYWGDHQLGSRSSASVVLLVPRSYERGYHHARTHLLISQSHSLGLQLDRCFLYESDALARLQEQSLSPVSLNSRRPIGSASIILGWVDEPAELVALLTMLSVASIPLHPSDRKETDSLLLIAGSIGRTPALPLQWADGVCITSSINQIARQLLELNVATSREQRLKLLEESQVVITAKKCSSSPMKWVAAADQITEGSPIVPLVDTARESYPVELWQSNADRLFPLGQTQSQSAERISPASNALFAQFRQSGMSQLEIAPCLDTPASQVTTTVRSLLRQLDATDTTVALPMIHPESCTTEFLDALSRSKRVPLHLLAGCGSKRVREIFGLGEAESLVQATKLIFEKGWRQISLSFWVGLPTETEDDQRTTIELIHTLAAIVNAPGQRHLVINLRPFVPIPHTAYQWDPLTRIEQLKSFAQKIGKKGMSGVQIRIDDRDDALLATSLRRLSAKQGAEYIERWTSRYLSNLTDSEFNAPELIGIPIDRLITGEEKEELKSICTAIPFSADLPWSVVQTELSSTDLQRMRTSGASTLAPSKAKTVDSKSKEFSPASTVGFGRDKKRLPSRTLSAPTRNRIRFQLSRGDELRFLSHLDFLRLIERAVRRAQLPVAYSGEEHRLMKLSFGPPLPVGATSDAEFFEITLEGIANSAMMEQFAKGLPNGLRVMKAQTVFGKEESLSAAINRVVYQVPLGECIEPAILGKQLEGLMLQSSIMIERESKKGIKAVDLRPAIRDLKIEQESLRMTLCLGEGRYARPSEVLSLLSDSWIYPIPALTIHRVSMFRESTDGIITDGMQL